MFATGHTLADVCAFKNLSGIQYRQRGNMSRSWVRSDVDGCNVRKRGDGLRWFASSSEFDLCPFQIWKD